MVRSRVGAVMMLLAAITSGCRTVRPEQAPGSGLSDGVHEFASGDARLWYRVAGRSSGAPPVVFLHGGPGQGSAHFDALAGPYLEPTLRMVYFDQRGSGHSERPESRNYAIPTLVEDIEALRRELGVPKIALIGHSFGAVLGLEYAARYPEHVARLVVAAGLWDTPYQCRLRAERLARVRPEAWARVRGDTLAENGTRRSDCDVEYLALPDPAEREAYNLEAMFPDPAISARIDSVNAAHDTRNTGEMGGALFSAGLLEYRFRAFDRITMPVLVIAGGRDGAAVSEGLRTLANQLPHARFVEFGNAGHFVYLDAPERFARELTAFIR